MSRSPLHPGQALAAGRAAPTSAPVPTPILASIAKPAAAPPMTRAAPADTAEWPADWLIPQWPAPAQVRALCTTRNGGVSAAPWNSFNLGDHVGDDPAAVAANRQRLAAALQAGATAQCLAQVQAQHTPQAQNPQAAPTGTAQAAAPREPTLPLRASPLPTLPLAVPPLPAQPLPAQPPFAPPVRPVFLQQVHGVQVAHLQPHTANGTVADAALTTAPGVACTIMVADCLPVLLTNRAGTVVAAAHAGWRGLAGGSAAGQATALQGTDPSASRPPAPGVLEQLFQQITALRQSNTGDKATKPIATDWLAWLGPCIGPQAFEVGPEVRQAFVDADPGAAGCFEPVAASGGASGLGTIAPAHCAPPTRYLANLPALARRRLQRLGITAIYGNDGSPAWCTASQPQRFFSHRRDAQTLGASGRMAACIWLEDATAVCGDPKPVG